MMFRALSGLMSVLAAWAAYLQLNDPDPERWFALYFATALIALAYACGRPVPRLALGLLVIALLWAGAIVPELVGRWAPRDLTATMVSSRPEIEFGREFGGLSIVAVYALAAALLGFRAKRAAANHAR